MLSFNQDTRQSIVVMGGVFPSSRPTFNHAKNASALGGGFCRTGIILRKNGGTSE